jgi:outer membrane protein
MTRAWMKLLVPLPVACLLQAAWLFLTACLLQAAWLFLTACLLQAACSPLPWRGADPAPPGFSLTPESPVRVGSVLTLEAAVKLARTRNPRVVAARFLEQQATAARGQQLAPALPQVKLSGRAARYLDPQRIASPSASGTSPTSVSAEDLGTWDATVSLNLFAGGRDVWRIRMAQSLLAAARDDTREAQRAVTELVVVAYCQAVWRQAVVEALQASAKALAAEAARQEALLAQEKASRLDVTRVRVRAAEVQDRAREEEALVELALLQLVHLLGLPSASGIRLEVPAAGTPAAGTPAAGTPGSPVPDEARLDWPGILARRPDLRAARQRMYAQQARVRAAQSELWPQLSLAGSFGQRVDITAWPVEEGHWRNSGYVGLELSWTPFEGGRVHYQVQQEEAALQAQIEGLRAQERMAVLEIRTALARLRSAQARLETSRESLALARTSLELERKKVELGQSTFTDFQLIEAAQLDAQVRLLQLTAEVRIAWVQYRLATGDL